MTGLQHLWSWRIEPRALWVLNDRALPQSKQTFLIKPPVGAHYTTEKNLGSEPNGLSLEKVSEVNVQPESPKCGFLLPQYACSPGSLPTQCPCLWLLRAVMTGLCNLSHALVFRSMKWVALWTPYSSAEHRAVLENARSSQSWEFTGDS